MCFSIAGKNRSIIWFDTYLFPDIPLFRWFPLNYTTLNPHKTCVLSIIFHKTTVYVHSELFHFTSYAFEKCPSHIEPMMFLKHPALKFYSPKTQHVIKLYSLTYQVVPPSCVCWFITFIKYFDLFTILLSSEIGATFTNLAN